MQVHLAFRPALPVPWAPVALPYSGPGRSVSGRQFPTDSSWVRPRDVDAGWTLLRKLMEPALNSRMVAVNTHVVSPPAPPQGVRGDDEGVHRLHRQRRPGVFLQRRYCKNAGYGLLKYADWGRLLARPGRQVQRPPGRQDRAQAYADEAARLIDLALGARSARAGGAGRRPPRWPGRDGGRGALEFWDCRAAVGRWTLLAAGGALLPPG